MKKKLYVKKTFEIEKDLHMEMAMWALKAEVTHKSIINSLLKEFLLLQKLDAAAAIKLVKTKQ